MKISILQEIIFLYPYLEKSKWSTIIKVYMSTWIHHTNQNDPRCNMNLDNHKNNNMCLVAWRKKKASTISIEASMATIIIILIIILILIIYPNIISIIIFIWSNCINTSDSFLRYIGGNIISIIIFVTFTIFLQIPRNNQFKTLVTISLHNAYSVLYCKY